MFKRHDQILEALARAGGKDPDFIKSLNEFKDLLMVFRQTREQEVIPLIFQGKNDEARKLAMGIQDERYEKLRVIALKMAEKAKARAAQATKESEDAASRAILIFLIVAVVAVVISGLLVMYLTRLIARPMQDIAQVAAKISSGNLAVAVPCRTGRMKSAYWGRRSPG